MVDKIKRENKINLDYFMDIPKQCNRRARGCKWMVLKKLQEKNRKKKIKREIRKREEGHEERERCSKETEK